MAKFVFGPLNRLLLLTHSLSLFLSLTGQMLIKWLISTLQSNCSINSATDCLNAMVLQFCNNLKYVGVLKQISNEHPQQTPQPAAQPQLQSQQGAQPAQQQQQHTTQPQREQDTLSGFSVSSINSPSLADTGNWSSSGSCHGAAGNGAEAVT